jgi:nicotinamide mononucleotide (NMN) deamidase PncC
MEQVAVNADMRCRSITADTNAVEQERNSAKHHRARFNGGINHSPASLSLAVSGVLGPEEDEDGNPVGLVYFCCVRSGGHRSS